MALGKLLIKCGFEYWDLGMDLEYKRRLGAGMMRRAEFVRKVKQSRVENKGVVLQCGGERKNAKEVVDWVQQQQQQPSTAANDTIENSKNNTQKEGEAAQPPSSDDKESSQKPNRKRPHEEGKEE